MPPPTQRVPQTLEPQRRPIPILPSMGPQSECAWEGRCRGRFSKTVMSRGLLTALRSVLPSVAAVPLLLPSDPLAAGRTSEWPRHQVQARGGLSQGGCQGAGDMLSPWEQEGGYSRVPSGWLSSYAPLPALNLGPLTPLMAGDCGKSEGDSFVDKFLRGFVKRSDRRRVWPGLLGMGGSALLDPHGVPPTRSFGPCTKDQMDSPKGQMQGWGCTPHHWARGATGTNSGKGLHGAPRMRMVQR